MNRRCQHGPRSGTGHTKSTEWDDAHQWSDAVHIGIYDSLSFGIRDHRLVPWLRNSHVRGVKVSHRDGVRVLVPLVTEMPFVVRIDWHMAHIATVAAEVLSLRVDNTARERITIAITAGDQTTNISNFASKNDEGAGSRDLYTGWGASHSFEPLPRQPSSHLSGTRP